jgi:alpha-tubulin suppressor-like RCC1 family protein
MTSPTGIASIHARSFDTVVLMKDGTVWHWGHGSRTQTEKGGALIHLQTPLQVKGLGGVTSVAVGMSQAAAVMNDGTVWKWGSYLGTSSPMEV